MQHKDPATTADLFAKVNANTARVAELKEELARSLAMDALFPGVFNGPGKVSSRVVGNMRFWPMHAAFRVTRADGKESELPVLSVPVELWGAGAFMDFIEGQKPIAGRPGCRFKVKPRTLKEFVAGGFS